MLNKMNLPSFAKVSFKDCKWINIGLNTKTELSEEKNSSYS